MELRSETVSSCEWMSVKEASRWASQYLQREIEESNILYLVQYGRVRKTHSMDYKYIGTIWKTITRIAATAVNRNGKKSLVMI